MRKKITLSMVSLLAISTLQAGTDGVSTKLHHGPDAKISTLKNNTADDLSTMFSNGKVSGQIRAFYINREYQGSSGASDHRDALAIGGHLKFETASYEGLNFAAAFYTTNGLFLDSPKNDFTKNDMSLLGKNNESYTMLGEAYVGYTYDKTALKIGRMKYDAPMMGGDDARMLRNLFEAYTLVNKNISNTTLSIGHINKFAQGSFGRVYNGGLLAATSGYSAVDTRGVDSGKFINMGTYAVGKSTNGVTNFQVNYVSDTFHVKFSDDYAWDLYNTMYADAGTSWNCLLNSDIHPFLQVQAIKQDSVGDNYLKYLTNSSDGEVDSFYWAGKFGAKYAGLTAYIAYSETTNNDSSEKTTNPYANAIVSQFGGMPAYTQGMVTRHQFFAGTKATKVAASYSFKAQGVNLSTAAYYASFDMDENSGYGVARTAYEPGFDIKYYPAAVKNLQLRFRGNFPRKYADAGAGNTGWSEYRFIANYNF